jgi:hypothetical protein
MKLGNFFFQESDLIFQYYVQRERRGAIFRLRAYLPSEIVFVNPDFFTDPRAAAAALTEKAIAACADWKWRLLHYTACLPASLCHIFSCLIMSPLFGAQSKNSERRITERRASWLGASSFGLPTYRLGSFWLYRAL